MSTWRRYITIHLARTCDSRKESSPSPTTSSAPSAFSTSGRCEARTSSSTASTTCSLGADHRRDTHRPGHGASVELSDGVNHEHPGDYAKRLLTNVAMENALLTGFAPNFAKTSGVRDHRCFNNAFFPSEAWRKKTAGVTAFFFEFLLPLAIGTACYARIVKTLRQKVAPQTACAVASSSHLGAGIQDGVGGQGGGGRRSRGSRRPRGSLQQTGIRQDD